MSKNLERALDIAKEIQAVETLEYLNKNWLYQNASDPAVHSRGKQECLKELVKLLERLDNESKAIVCARAD